MELTTGPNDAGRRLDRILRRALPDYPLSLLHRLLRQGRILVNGCPAGPQDRAAEGSHIVIRDLPPEPAPFRRRVLSARLPPLLWQGGGLLILNKPAGMPAHGPDSLDTLVNAYLSGKLPHSLSFRPGPLHRLDQPSSGIIVFSMNIDGARIFSALMRERKIQKKYLALAEGRIETEEVWQDELFRDKSMRKTLKAKESGETVSALTTVRPLAVSAWREAEYTLLLAEIATGRTHQIRAQAAAHGHPLAGDTKYGGHPIPHMTHNTVPSRASPKPGGTKNRTGGRFFLHAWIMTLGETGNGFPRSVTAPVPQAFQNCAGTLFGAETVALINNYSEDKTPDKKQ
ncbi:MAG: RluA family pseudouridine synthase [Treponema sp.]|nr:RluA family pseudouridine synthase [Treponema sp.]